jgi:hypothetical protein
MNRNKIVIIILFIIVVGVVVSWGRSPLSTESPRSDVVPNPSNQQKGAILENYHNDLYGFSFDHLPGVTVESSVIEGSDMFVVVDTHSDNVFQIYVQQNKDGVSDISESRIRQDIPDISIRDIRDVEVGDGAKGVAFISKDTLGDKREVWFVFKSSIYQISAPIASDEFVKSVLNTWTFYNNKP